MTSIPTTPPINPLCSSEKPIDIVDSAKNVVHGVSALMAGNTDLHMVNERALTGLGMILMCVTDALEYAVEQLHPKSGEG